MFPLVVAFPKGRKLEAMKQVYARMGLPGACGSLDTTHVWWDKAPVSLTNVFKGI